MSFTSRSAGGPISHLMRRVPPLHISTFIGILHLLIGLLGAGLISVFSLYFIYESGVQASLREIEGLGFTLDNALEDTFTSIHAGSSSVDDLQRTLNRYLKGRSDVRYVVLHPNGEPWFQPPLSRELSGVSIASTEVSHALTQTIGQSIRRNGEGQRTIYVATAIYQGGEMVGFLVLGERFDQVMAPTFRTMSWFSLIALLIVAFTVVEGWLGANYISRPLTRLSAVAESLSQGDLSARAELQGPVEVIHLSRTLNEMAARLQSSLASLRAFVANASHELRTPLTSIKLQVGVLRGGAIEEPEVAERFLGQMESEIDRLVYMVNDMLDLSQIEGGPTLAFQTVNLNDLADEVEAFWEARSHQADLCLTLRSAPNLPLIQGDPYRLRQLLDNLLDNAMKNTPAGGQVEIVFENCLDTDGRTGQDGSPVKIHIEVRDNGDGIGPEHLPRIFDRFYHVAAHPHSGGSGLGLAIARSIVEAHGGKIGVSSQLGKGSIFWVDLPE